MNMSKIKTVLSAALLACGSIVYAQSSDDDGERVRMSYGFEEGRLDRSEYAEKSKKVLIDGDHMVIMCRKEKEDALSVARLPIYPRDNFKLDYNMTVPKLDEKHLFGVVFNYRDEENYNGVLFDSKKFYYVTKENGAMYTEKKGAVKFGGKRNVPVSVTLVHVGNER